MPNGNVLLKPTKIEDGNLSQLNINKNNYYASSQAN